MPLLSRHIENLKEKKITKQLNIIIVELNILIRLSNLMDMIRKNFFLLKYRNKN